VSDLTFDSPVEFQLWTAVYAAMVSRPHWRRDEDVHAISGEAADEAVRELRQRNVYGVNGERQSLSLNAGASARRADAYEAREALARREGRRG